MKRFFYLLIIEIVPITLFADNIDEKINLLEKKIDLFQQAINTITAHYHWSFFLVFTMLLLFIGGNLFNNRRKISEELEQTTQALEDSYKKNLSLLFTETDKKVLELKERQKNEFSFYEARFEYQILEVKFESSEIETHKMSIALRILKQLIYLYSNIKDWDFSFQKYLTFLCESVNSGKKFSYHEADEVNTIIGNLPERFQTQKNSILGNIVYE